MTATVGIQYDVLRALVLEALKLQPQTQMVNLINDVTRLADQHNVFPSETECEERGMAYGDYRQRRLSAIDECNVNQIVWDLIVERILTVGRDKHNPDWPWMRLTAFGQTVVDQTHPSYYDPEGYLAALRGMAPGLDPVIEQYMNEALRAFRKGLLFASAVMLGAAAEKAVLLVLDAIGKTHTNAQAKQRVEDLLGRVRLPAVYTEIDSTITALADAKVLPYAVHQGSTQHLISLFEMVRVQRNDAVHPIGGQVRREKILLAIQGLPAALEAVYRLIDWFGANPI